MPHKTLLRPILFGRTLWYVSLCLLFIAFISLNTFFVTPPRTAEAATSSTMNFQARLLQSSGALVADGYYNVEFKLWDASVGGNNVWTETYKQANRVRVVNGYLTVNLGTVTAFGSINWDQEHWLTMNIGGTANTADPDWDGEMTPRLKLTAVPYAFTAGKLQQNTGGNTSTLGFATQTGARNILLPDESGTLCIQGSGSCGFVTGSAANYIQNGTSPQTANFNVTGNGTVGGTMIANLFQGSGASLTNLNASNVGSGTLGDAYLSSNVALLNRNSQIFTGNEQIFRNATNSANAFRVQNAAGNTAFNVDTTNSTYALVEIGGTGYDFSEIVLKRGSAASWGIGTDSVDDFYVYKPGEGVALALSDTGEARFRNFTNSTTAFQIQDASGGSLLTADTQNSTITVTDFRPKEVGTLNTGVEYTTLSTGIDDGGPWNGNTKWTQTGADGFIRTVYSQWDAVTDLTDVVFVRCTDIDCTSPVRTVIAEGQQDVNYGSPVIKMVGNIAHIGYEKYDYSDYESSYQYVRCSNQDCTSPDPVTIFGPEEEQEVGEHTAIDVGSDGNARVALSTYNDNTSTYELIFILCGQADCSSGTRTTTTITSIENEEGWINGNINMLLGSDDNAYITFGNRWQYAGTTVNLIHCNNADCSDYDWGFSEDTGTDGWVGPHDLAIDSNGYPVIVYTDNSSRDTLYMARCSNEWCENWDIYEIAQHNNINDVALELDGDDRPIIAYDIYNELTDTNIVNYVYCSDFCEDDIINIQSLGGSGGNVSMALDGNGLASILYVASDYKNLNLARLMQHVPANTGVGTSIGSESNPFGSVYSVQMSANMLYLQGGGEVLAINNLDGKKVLSVDTTQEKVIINAETIINNEMNVKGHLTARDGLSVNGGTSISGDLEVESNLYVHGSNFSISDLIEGWSGDSWSNPNGVSLLDGKLEVRGNSADRKASASLYDTSLRIGSNRTYVGKFSDTFESGTFDLWDSVVGDVSVSTDSFNSGTGTSSAVININNSPSELKKSIGEHDNVVALSMYIWGAEPGNIASVYNSNGDRFSAYIDSEGIFCIYNGATDTDTCIDEEDEEIWQNGYNRIGSFSSSRWIGINLTVDFDGDITAWYDGFEGWGEVSDSSGTGAYSFTQIGVGDPSGVGINTQRTVDNVTFTPRNHDDEDWQWEGSPQNSDLLVGSSLVVSGSSVFKGQVLVQNAAGGSMLNVNGHNNSITLGENTLFTLGSFSDEPAGTNGSMYYDTTLSKFRCYQDDEWVDCIGGSGGGGGDILQGGNSFGVGGMTIGTNDNYDLSFKTNGTTKATLTTAGMLQLATQGDTGGLQIGGDINLYRSAANVLSLATGDSFNLVSGNLQFGGTTVIDSSRILQNVTASADILTSGTLADARLSSNVVLLNRNSQIFTGNDQIFRSTASNAFRIQNAGGTTMFRVNTEDEEILMDAYAYLFQGARIGDFSASGTVLTVRASSGNNGIFLNSNSGNSPFMTWSNGTQEFRARTNNTHFYLGHGSFTPTFSLSNTGQTAFQNSTDSTTAFQVQNAGGSSIFNVNTTNGLAGIRGTGTNGSEGKLTFGDYSQANWHGATVGEYGSGDTNILQLQGAAGLRMTVGGIGEINALSIDAAGDIETYRDLTVTDDLFVEDSLYVTGFAEFNTGLDVYGWGINTYDSGVGVNEASVDVRRSCSSCSAIVLWEVGNDDDPRFNMLVNGEMRWGDGSNGFDTYLYRSTAGTLKTDGNLHIQTDTNSATAFVIQNASSTALLTADTTSSRITVGNDSGTVSLRVGGGTNRIETNGSNQLRLYGSARNAKKITLTPEYAGAVLNGTGIGNMTAGFDISTYKNYYDWVSGEGSVQSYSVVVQAPVPSDWDAWASSNSICIDTRSSDTTKATALLTVFDSDNNPNDVLGESITPSSNNVWANNCFSLTSSDYSSDGVMTVAVVLISQDSEAIQAGNITLNYLSKF